APGQAGEPGGVAGPDRDVGRARPVWLRPEKPLRVAKHGRRRPWHKRSALWHGRPRPCGTGSPRTGIRQPAVWIRSLLDDPPGGRRYWSWVVVTGRSGRYPLNRGRAIA